MRLGLPGKRGSPSVAGAPRNCPAGQPASAGGLRPAVPMATGWPGPGFTANRILSLPSPKGGWVA